MADRYLNPVVDPLGLLQLANLAGLDGNASIVDVQIKYTRNYVRRETAVVVDRGIRVEVRGYLPDEIHARGPDRNSCLYAGEAAQLALRISHRPSRQKVVDEGSHS